MAEGGLMNMKYNIVFMIIQLVAGVIFIREGITGNGYLAYIKIILGLTFFIMAYSRYKNNT